MSSHNSERTAQWTLYDPPTKEGQCVPDQPDDDHEVLDLELPEDLSRRLIELATHLGLPPSTVASRAIGFVCDEIDTVDESALSTGTLIQQYQARLDILHKLEEDGSATSTATGSSEEDDPWKAVDQIIQKAEADS
jgi:hypothetical protein